jgi:hypothetical protein
MYFLPPLEKSGLAHLGILALKGNQNEGARSGFDKHKNPSVIPVFPF